MKQRLAVKFLIFHLIVAACSTLCIAQNSNTAAPNPQGSEVVSENDPLPFMQKDQNAEVQEPTSGGLLLKTLGAMILIIGLIFAGAWGARKLGFGDTRSHASSDETDLAIVSTVSLGSGRTISAVRFGDRVLIVGSTAQSFTLLAEGTPAKQISFENSRSVGEMLEHEGANFAAEFEQAKTRLDFPNTVRPTI